MPSITIIQRVTHLLTLAADSGASDNEARNAALTAAKLIAQHGLRVVDAHDATTATTHTTTQTTTRTTTATSKAPAWSRVWTDAEQNYWERCVHEAHAEYERRTKEQPIYRWVAQEPSKCGSCWADIPTGSDCFYGPYPKHQWRCVPCAQRDAPPRRKPKSKKTKASTK